tara:strand:+ start:502 stop:678 length:177 start_codon:yes stop_codon:yes gene_type:complete
MKTFEILDKENKILDSFEEMTYKKAIKKLGNKYDGRTIILSYINKHGNKVNKRIGNVN